MASYIFEACLLCVAIIDTESGGGATCKNIRNTSILYSKLKAIFHSNTVESIHDGDNGDDSDDEIVMMVTHNPRGTLTRVGLGGAPLSYMKNDAMHTVIYAAFCMLPSLELQDCTSF